tara:strand:- start:3819 stop:4661 length:843 start_codon:yes stop_codon:yes gene_type:complete
MKKNVATQDIGAQMIIASSGEAFAGTTTVYVTGDGGTQALGGTASGVCTSEGNGYFSYVPTQAETNYDHIAFTFIGTLAIPATIQVFTSFPQTVDNDVLASGATGFAAIDTVVDAIKVKTDFLPSVTAGGAGGVFIAGTNAATTVTTSFTTTFTGNLTGSVDSVTGDTKQTGDSFARIGAAGASLTDLGGMSTAMKAEVNVEALDVVNTDTMTLIGQATPSNTPTMREALGFVYKMHKNEKWQTATQLSLYNNAGTVVDQKATASDDATTAKLTGIVTGP